MIKYSLIGIAVVFAVFLGARHASPQLRQGAGAPSVESVSFYADWRLTQPIDTVVEPGTTIYTKIVFSEPMKLKVAADNTARPVLYYRVGEERIRYRIARHGASGADFVSGDAKPLRSGTDDYICKYTVPEGATGEFTTMVGRLSADISGNTMENFYTHPIRLAVGGGDVAPAVNTGGRDPNLPQPTGTLIDQQAGASQVVHMPDLNLRKAVVAAINEHGISLGPINIPKGPQDIIYAGEIWKIPYLRAGAAGIESLTGLEYAKNLESLLLGNTYSVHWDVTFVRRDEGEHYKVTKPPTPNRIDDLRPLEGLTNLVSLYLDCNAVRDLSPLRNLRKLRYLGLEENEITDISALAELTNLKQLLLDNHYYSPLWAGNNAITDLSPLRKLRNLEELRVGQNPIRGRIGVVRNFPKLNALEIDCTGVSNLRPLVECPGLRGAGSWVYLGYNPLTEGDLDDINALRARGVEVTHGLHYLEDERRWENLVERCSVSYLESFRAAPALQLPMEPGLLSAVWHDLSQIPEETALLPNYPNPFNPETWIPYQLATSAEVAMAIHAADGRLVRVLALGHQPAGMYESKGRAAYWDGRNLQGEPVASGVYFYTLRAGDFTATRKLLIRK